MKALYTIIFSLSVMAIVGNVNAQSKAWSIVTTYQIPEGASGLAYDGTYIYFGIYGSGGNQVYQLDPADGTYSLLCNGPQEDAFGLTHDGTNLWTTDHPGSSSDPAIAIEFDASGSLISQFDLPAHYMSGIAYDNGDFWVSAYYDPDGQIYKVGNTGAIIKQFAAPDNQPWDLALGDSCLWMADYWGDVIYQIDTADGSLINSYASEGTDPAGIVFDGAFLWYCDNGAGGNDYLYKVDLSGSGTPAIQLPSSSYYYGAVAIGETSTWEMQINNIGTADLEISNLIIPGAAPIFSSTSFPFTIPAGSNSTVSIDYIPSDYSALNTVVTLESTDPINPSINVELTGYGVYNGTDLTLSANYHNYGSTRQNAFSGWFCSLENSGDEILTIDTIISTNNNFIIDYDITYPLNISILDTLDIRIWYNPDESPTDNGEIYVYSNSIYQNIDTLLLEGSSNSSEWLIGDVLWSFNLTGSYDVSPKGILSIPDINGDGINDVVVASEDATYRCFNGNSHAVADLLWENTENGSLYQQNAIDNIADINNDGYDDIIVGSAWGDRSVIAISGKTGINLWKYDTHIYGDGGWIYQVDVSYDFNNDGMNDVLAASGDDPDGNGPKRIHCLNGNDGSVIWEYPCEGAAFAVNGVEDFNGDGQADVIAGITNSDESQGKILGIDGVNGTFEWSVNVGGSSVWAVTQIPDVNDDGINDVAAGDFGLTSGGTLYYIDPTTGSQLTTSSVSNSSLVLGFEKMNDVNADGKFDLLPSHSGAQVVAIDGMDATEIWDYAVSAPDKPWCSRVIDDITGDGINDVVAGTLYEINEVIFLDGVYGTELKTISYGEPIDAMGTIGDITQEGSMEVVVGGRNGKLICYAGGTESAYPVIVAPESHNFGQVSYWDTVTWNMQVENIGDAPLQIDTVVAYTYIENFYSTAEFPITIDAGGIQEIPVVFLAEGQQFELIDSIQILSNDIENPSVNVDVVAYILDGVEENSLDKSINIYPNPAKEKLTIEINSEDVLEISVMDANGQEVFKSNIDANKYIWDCKTNQGKKVGRGTYFIHLLTPTESTIKRIVIL